MEGPTYQCYDSDEDGEKSMKYIQNRTNWCWVAACKVAGEQYKKNFTEFAFTLENPETGVAVSNLDGLHTCFLYTSPSPRD